jgi:peptide/nickel transport system permease protein
VAAPGILQRLRHDRAVAIAATLLAIVALMAIFARYVAPYDPNQQFDIVGLSHRAPSAAHPFGTDQFSRDVLSRVIFGARVSLSVAALAVLISSTIGLCYGIVAGYVGGAVDTVMMRVIDALLSIPGVLLLIGVLSFWGNLPLTGLILLLGLTGWFGVSRLVRAEVVALREREFVTAARALGVGHGRVVVRHILPHVILPVLVTATLAVAHVIVLEAGLSYLGVGVRPPHASWGNVIHDGIDGVQEHWWVSVFPGIALAVTTLAVNTVADGLRDALDPRQLPGR